MGVLLKTGIVVGMLDAVKMEETREDEILCLPHNNLPGTYT
jgi:hypothetical protein